MNQAQIFIERFGIALIVLGVMLAIGNWIILCAHLNLKRKGSSRNISMIAVLGLSLPLGFLFFDALRPHALWIWIVDPATSSVVFILLRDLTLEIRSRRQK